MPDDNARSRRGEVPGARNPLWLRLSQTLLVVSALLCLGLALCYWMRPDAFAAFTIFPVWCSALLGLLLTGMGWHRQLRRPFQGVAVLWLLFLLVFAEEPHSLLRGLWPAPAQNAAGLRVVSLNCSAGNPLAGAEVAKWNPDVVLLQESPSRSDVERLARRLYGNEGGFVWGVDGSIIARGELTPRDLPPALGNYFVQAGLRLPQGREVEIVSLRLMTPPFRIDWWSAAGREAYRASRELQTTQMNAIAQQIGAVPEERAIFIGGDFNAPQGDAIYRVLRPRLRDSFARAGRGWGNTIINEFPALRIDQIWASDGLQPQSVTAHKTENTDHRAVVADFLWRTD